MAIRNIGNDPTRIADFPNDIKGNKPTEVTAPQTTVASTNAPSLPPVVDRSGRAKNTLSSRSVKAALDAKLGDQRPVIGREYQTAIKNLRHGSDKLGEAAAKYRTKIEDSLHTTKSDAQIFLKHAHEAEQTFSQNRNQVAQSLPQISQTLDHLIGQLQSVIKTVTGSTNDFLANVSSSLKGLTLSTEGFHSASATVAQGQAMALNSAMKALQNSSNEPVRVTAMANEYAKAMISTVEPLGKNTQALAQKMDTEVDSFSLGGAIKDIFGGIKSGAQKLAEKAYDFKYSVTEKVKSYIDEYVGPITKSIGVGLKNLFNSVFKPDRNPQGKPIELNKLVSNTQDLRDTIAAAKTGDTQALAKLKNSYGYTLDTAPKPGQMWVPANFSAGELVDGKVTASHFPGISSSPTLAKPVDNRPADIGQVLFGAGRGVDMGNSRPLTLKGSDGNMQTVTSMTDYKEVVAANRAKYGMPVQGGEPIPIHLSLEGGGGKGKRYAPAFAEMYNLGIVPASVSGVSVGAIAAALVAAGLDPRKADETSKDPQAKKFFDATIAGPGILDGRELYRYMDNKLRELTGIKDRPVTFADLPMPLYLVTSKFADSQAPNDLTKPEDRTFTFSKESTPNTPVAAAVLASAAIPAAFDPIEFVDVATGRTIRLFDGGVVDQLPIGYQSNKQLPELAIQLNEPNINNPKAPENNATVQPLPPGNLISNNPFGNAKLGLDVQAKSAANARDYQDRTNPRAGTFVLNIPTWNLKDFSKQDSTFEFEYNDKIDPELDQQSTVITRNFFQQFMGKLLDPQASGTNLNKVPSDSSFTRTFDANGASWKATHTNGSDEVVFQSNTGKTHHVKLGKERLENWLADDLSFGDIPNRLRDVLVDHEKFLKTFGL